VILDKRGSLIEIGSKVAFNLSGDVAIGEIVKCDTRPFHIMLSHRAAGMPAGHISRVRNVGSLIVLRANDHE
jgi:hypothetical protein